MADLPLWILRSLFKSNKDTPREKNNSSVANFSFFWYSFILKRGAKKRIWFSKICSQIWVERSKIHVWVGELMEVAFFYTISELWTQQVITLHCLFSWTRVCEEHGGSAPDSCGGTPGIFEDSNNHCWKTAAGVQEAMLQSWVWDQEGLPGQSHLCQVRMC